MNKQLNLATIKLDAFLKLESNNKMINLLNAQDTNIESTKITTDHLKNMHLKQIVINNQNSIDKNIMAGGYYIDYNINRNITDNDVIKYGSIETRIAYLQGILDSDGYVNKHGQPSIEQTSKQLCI
jgi:intein/homing endonuclease